MRYSKTGENQLEAIGQKRTMLHDNVTQNHTIKAEKISLFLNSIILISTWTYEMGPNPEVKMKDQAEFQYLPH